MQASDTSCLYECSNKLNLVDGRAIEFKQLFRELGFDYHNAQLPHRQKLISDLPQPFYVIGEDGDLYIDQIYYNGLSTIYKVTFEDGSIYGFTGDHKLLAHYTYRQDEFYKVRNLVKGDEIVHLTHIRDANNEENILQTIQSYVKIDNIELANKPHHTWEIVSSEKTYLLPNGCVALNGLFT